jgi:hypothetical protein
MVLQGIGKSYWTVSLDMDGWSKNAINQLSKSNLHLTKLLNQSSIAHFQIFSKYLIPRKIAIRKHAF